MKYHVQSRRHFLQGIGGTAIALPFMSSLSPTANAQTSAPKFFVCMASPHGGVNVENYFPAVTPSNTLDLYSYQNHQARWDNLTGLRSSIVSSYNPSGALELSPVLGEFLNPYLNDINVINGLDLMFGGGHHQGGHLGNFHGNDSRDFNTGIDSRMTLDPMPTIDQVMAYSSAFYGSNDPMAARTMNISPGRSIVFRQQGSQVQPASPPNWGSLQGLFDTLFSTDTAGTLNRSSMIDRVIEDYRRITQSTYGPGRRISQEDRLRLNGFVDELNDLEGRLRNRADSCPLQPATRPNGNFTYNDTDLSNLETDWGMYLDLLLLGFQCGRSRIATISIANSSDFVGDWHQSIAHQHLSEEPQRWLTQANRWIAEHIFTALVSRLNTDAGLGDGSSYLDHSLVVWQHESGRYTHDGISCPTLMAGRAGGYFNTGMYVDYRSLNNLGASRWWNDLNPGLPQNRWLNTILLSMGIPESEFRRDEMPGYGDPWQVDGLRSYQNHESWNAQVIADCNSPLPIIVA